MSSSRRHRARTLYALVAGGLLLAACGADGPDGPDPETANASSPTITASEGADRPTTTLAPTTTTTTAIAGHRTVTVPATVSYVVPDGAIEYRAPRAAGVDTKEVQITLNMPTWYADFSRADALDFLAAPPADVGAWLTNAALPPVAGPEPVTVGGVSGERWLQGPLSGAQRFSWAGSVVPPGTVECLAVTCVPLFGDDEGFYAAEDALSTWIVALELPAGRLLATVTDTMAPGSKQSPRSPEQLWAAAQPFLETVRFEDTGPAPAVASEPLARRLDAGR